MLLSGEKSQHRKLSRVAQAALIAAVLGVGSVASSQQPGEITKDVIFARKTLMDSLSDDMDKIETMIDTAKVNLASGKDDAETISVMLMAFPHLFPSSSNQWKPNVDLDPATDTFASPDVWSSYRDFYQRAQNASSTAHEAGRAENEADFKKQIGLLRAACNGCHALYMKTQ